MLSSYPVTCPHLDCRQDANLVPARVPGGPAAEVRSGQPAWFRCPHCARDWEGRIRGDEVIPLEPVHTSV